MITLTGRLLCQETDLELVERFLPDHIRLSRAEPGCLSFDVSPLSDNPLIYEVSETFKTRADFDAHQKRTKASPWGKETAHIPREYQISEEPA